VFCRALNGLLALIGPSSAQSDAFLWHDGAPPEGSDTDGDRWPDIVDSCPTVANRDQADADGDGVGDACDNCVTFPNPRMSPTDYLRANPWVTLTGGQRDDDHDGYGNLCDASFPPAQAPVVGEADLIAFRASMGRMRSSDACGVNHDQPCAIFDLDQVGTVTNVSDLARLRELTDRPPGPKCPTCPLECVSGPDGSCD
jgi:hypothetical protein